MRRKVFRRVEIPLALVGMKPGLISNVLTDYLLDRTPDRPHQEHGMCGRCRRARPARRLARLSAGRFAALRCRGGPAVCPETFATFRLAIVGFVGLDNLSFATERPKAARPHCFADTVAMNQADL